MDNGLLTGAVFIDLMKAFDTLDHHILLNKLQRYGICNRTLLWFSSYLLGRSQCVEVDKALSSPLDIASGVPQGSILGSLLFILYISDMPPASASRKFCFMQTIQCCFLTTKTAIELEANLNNDVNRISSWLEENKLFFNMSKTEYVIYGLHQRLKREDSVSLSCNGSSLTKSESFKYLGVVIDQHLSFNNHIERVVSRKLGVFRRLRISIPMAAAERLYKTMILPVFDYCDVAWHGCGKANSDVLERLQHRAAKLILPNSGLDTKELNATLGLVPLINRRKLHIVLLARKCLDGSVPPYLNHYFNLNTSIHTFATRRCNDIHLPKVNLEVAKKSFYFTGAMEFNGLPHHIKAKESFIEFSRATKDFFLNY